MTGGFLSVGGLVAVILGVLALLAGLATAGHGFVDENRNHGALLSDPERSSMNEDLMEYGLLGAGSGLLLLTVGIVLAIAGSATRSTPDASRGRGFWVAGGLGIVLALALMVSGFVGDGPEFASFGAEGRTVLLDEAVFGGQVRNAYSTPVQSGTTDSSQSTQTFQAPAGATYMEMDASWTPQDMGARDLRIIIEIQEDGAWRERGRVGGQGPLSLDLQGPDLDGATMRYRVFADNDVSIVLEQDFRLSLRFYGTHTE